MVRASLLAHLGSVAEDFTMQSKRRCAKQAAVKARMAARKEDEEDNDKDGYRSFCFVIVTKTSWE